jgi:DNA-binding CsgD family transcriptional regulator
MGDGTEVHRLAQLAALSPRTALKAADQLAAADVLAAERPPRFLHPLLRSAVYDDIPLGVLAQLHSRAADLLSGFRADPEAVAGHLLRCDAGTGAEIVERLRAAAERAQRRGAPETAVAYLERALAETAGEATRVTVLAELGRAELLAGSRASADHLREAVASCSDPLTRATIRNDLADAVRAGGDRRTSLRVRLQALEDVGDRDLDASERIQVRISIPMLTSRHTPQTSDRIEQLQELARGDRPSARPACLSLAWLLTMRGEPPDRVWPYVDRGLGQGAFLAEETSEAPAAFWAACALLHTDELSRARTLARDMQADASARGSKIGFATATLAGAVADLRAGLLADAEASLRATLEVTQPRDLIGTISAAWLANALLELGRTDAARAQIEGVELAPGMEDDVWGAWVLVTRGRVRCGVGDTDGGVADLRSCGELAEDIGVVSPLLLPWRSELARILAGRSPEEARHLADRDLEVALGTGISGAIGVALCSAAAPRPDREAIDLLLDAVARLDRSPAILERARALLGLGSALRRLGRRIDAREPLRQALEIAASSGAAPLAGRAREEAILAGGRPRRPRLRGLDALTAAELRAARLAAEGSTNREIAEALFITAKTVGDHLSSAYSKLDITSRAELPAALAP